MRVIAAGLGSFGKSWAGIVRDGANTDLVGVVEPHTENRAWGIANLGLPEERIFPTLEEARAANQEADDAGKFLMVSQNYRFRAPARAIQRLVREGAIGPLVSVSLNCQRDMRLYYEATNFRYLMRHPYVIDMSIHHFDQIRALTGENAISIHARSWRVPDSPFRHDPSMAAMVTLESGAPLLYQGSGATYRPLTSWNGDWELIGEEGKITWTGGVDDADGGEVMLQCWGQEPVEVEFDRSGLQGREL